ncbi:MULTISPECIES: serine/threonine-protein kinase [Streptomycetaceae]|uniref:serine/threonine-protein kinase n=1 Tax=Streptomycetaceae TaxID=2062 RepID=UPI000213F0CE|nr:serine/threonine-protein kinase [Streptantibioticus cattleyicolor]MYS57546.1 protein kinase [Streptomyces sp. SID5468]CCB73138.1 conserved protein of unknown function [Streptantibioticus cattleyicolor NRRL 8057 = DSM 46488]
MPTGEADDGEATGTLLGGRYRLAERLGKGGMGVVCRAVDEVLGREVAVKVLRAYSDAGPAELAELRTRMQREARAAARVRHPGVITVHDVTEQDGRPVIVMELIDGPSLDDVLRDRGPLDPRSAAAIGAEVMAALDAAHQAGVLHRDVKPGNVLLDRGGRVVLTDFGIASMEAPGDDAATKLTRSGELVGSLDFLPPERAQGQDPGPASDVWSLGMTLYVAVEGGSPFQRTSVWSTLTAIVTEPLPPPHRCGPLTPVLQAMLAKDPAARPTARQAAEMLTAVAAGHPLPAAPGPSAAFGPPPPMAPPAPETVPTPTAAPAPPATAAAPRRGNRRRVLLAATATAVVLAVAGAAGYGLYHTGPPSPAAHGVAVAAPSGTAREGVAPGEPKHGMTSARPSTPASAASVSAPPSSPHPSAPGHSTAPERSPAPPPQAPACTPIGGGKVNCSVWRAAPSYTAAGARAGTLNAGTNYFYCQANLGRRESYGKWTNVWWARTDDDSGNSGVYVSDVYLKGGADDQPVPGLPVC